MTGQRFSPLLDGDGVASRLLWPPILVRLLVSVPFSMGTVLLRYTDVRQKSMALLVSVPFSMGTVLLRCRAAGVREDNN